MLACRETRAADPRHRTAPSLPDREWAAKMKEISLQPSKAGQPGGKQTGQSVTHYIIPEAFARPPMRSV